MRARKVRIGWVDRRDDREDEYELLVAVTPGSPGRGPDMNGPGEPPEGPEIEVLQVADEHGVQHPELVEVAQDALGVDPWQALEAADEDAEAEELEEAERQNEAAAERRAEALRERLYDIAGVRGH